MEEIQFSLLSFRVPLTVSMPNSTEGFTQRASAELAPAAIASLEERGLAALRDLEIREGDPEARAGIEGIRASDRSEAYGCIFGRDSLITALELLSSEETARRQDTVRLVAKISRGLAKLQGTKTNIQNGEQPGKIPHEYRPSGHEHLTGKEKPDAWFVDPETGAMISYDSVDSTPLFVLTVARFVRQVGIQNYFDGHMKIPVRRALAWISDAIDEDARREHGTGLLTYTPWKEQQGRTYGGLTAQSWMDSSESLPPGIRSPIAPVEAQAYAYAALRAGAAMFQESDVAFAETLNQRANTLKETFNERFIARAPEKEEGGVHLYSAIAGDGTPIDNVRSSMGHVLWATWPDAERKPDGILDEKYVSDVVKRLLQPDLFVPHAGVRTLSSDDEMFKENSYHNGSVWPHDTFILSEGLERYGYRAEAQRVRQALLRALNHFDTPIELFVVDKGASDGEYMEYLGSEGQKACRKQAWAAAAMAAGAAMYRKG